MKAIFDSGLLPVALLFGSFVLVLALCRSAAEPVQWWQCSWCGRWFDREGRIARFKPGCVRLPQSHGICPQCYQKEIQKNK